ncbi:hypothetical protein Agub_g15774 [Astrephomene gubernaculifera]|uniref:Uncharacterized protein n=1 Tax=Astrephomene gubernaculifera TaxID=47775 RepID=A0AAD3HUG1_9CHLO|nr:hypothetical protein Agub_g15774 [Astrephomene gubernaculifera]
MSDTLWRRPAFLAMMVAFAVIALSDSRANAARSPSPVKLSFPPPPPPITKRFPFLSCGANDCTETPLEMVFAEAEKGSQEGDWPSVTFRIQRRANYAGNSSSSCHSMLRGVKELRIRLHNATLTSKITATVNGAVVNSSIKLHQKGPEGPTYFLVVPLRQLSAPDFKTGATVNVRSNNPFMPIVSYIVDTSQFVGVYNLTNGNGNGNTPYDVYDKGVTYSLVRTGSDACCPKCTARFQYGTPSKTCSGCGGGSIYSYCVVNRVSTDCRNALIQCLFAQTVSNAYYFTNNNPTTCYHCSSSSSLNMCTYTGVTISGSTFCCSISP